MIYIVTLIWLSKPFSFFWFFQFFLAVLTHLYIQMNFKSYLSSTTKTYWDLNWNCVKFIYYFREAWHLYNIESALSRTWCFLFSQAIYPSIKLYHFLNVHLAHSCFTSILHFYCYLFYYWQVHVCINGQRFCMLILYPAFILSYFIHFSVTFHVFIQNEFLITILTSLKFLNNPSGQSPNSGPEIHLFLLHIQKKHSVSLLCASTKAHQGYINKYTKLPAIKKLTFKRNWYCVLALPMDPSSSPCFFKCCTLAKLN